MPNKNAVVESIRHHLLRALERAARTSDWSIEVGESFDLVRDGDALHATWLRPMPGRLVVDRKTFQLYSHSRAAGDPAAANEMAADRVVAEIAAVIGK